MIVYLDTNIYCRPLDDRSQPRINLEAEACLSILRAIEKGKIKSVTSDILKLEIYHADPIKKLYTIPFLAFSSKHIKESEELKNNAQILQRRYHLKSRDVLHLASAIKAKVEFFITCDDELIQKSKKISEIKILNPIEYLRQIS